MLFNKEIDEKKLINYMLELIYKSNALLDMIDPTDDLRLMEMSINKNDIMCKFNPWIYLYSGQKQAGDYKTRQAVSSATSDHNQGGD